MHTRNKAGIHCEPISIKPGYQFEVHRVAYQRNEVYACMMHFHQVHEFIIFEDVQGMYYHSQGQSAIQKGDVVFTPALETHDYELTEHAKAWYIIQFMPQFLIDNGLLYEEAILRRGLQLRFSQQDWQSIQQQVNWLEQSYLDDPHSVKSATLLKLIIIWLVAQGKAVLPNAERALVTDASYKKLSPILSLFREQDVVELTLVEAAAMCHISTSYFSRLFKRTFNCNYSQFVVQHKLYTSARWLGQSEKSITQISYDLNFSNPSHFISMFKRYFSKTPNQYRKALRKQLS